MKQKDTLYEDTLRTAVERLNELEPGSEEYKRQAESIQCLMASQSDSKNQRSRNVTALMQTGVASLCSIMGILILIAFEKGGNVVTLKDSFKLIPRPKV